MVDSVSVEQATQLTFKAEDVDVYYGSNLAVRDVDLDIPAQ